MMELETNVSKYFKSVNFFIQNTRSPVHAVVSPIYFTTNFG